MRDKIATHRKLNEYVIDKQWRGFSQLEFSDNALWYLFSQIKAPAKQILRDDRRSFVKVCKLSETELATTTVVVKQPRHKNNSAWMRFTTLYRQSEVYRDFQALLLLQALEIKAPKPLIIFEKKVNKMIIDQWIIYQFIDAQEAQVDDITSIISILQTLHQHRYRHDDPHIKNFLKDDNGILYVIDCKPRKALLGSLNYAYDYIMLAERSANIKAQIYNHTPELIKQSISFKVAKKHFEFNNLKRITKRFFRSFKK